MYDFIIVGGGIGGICSAVTLNQKYKTLLLEKEPKLGGCSGTFSRGKYSYNIGATTFAMYQDGQLMKQFFDTHDIKFDFAKLEIPICVHINNKIIYRHSNLEKFITHINEVFPHPLHQKFWRDIFFLSESFYRSYNLYYNKSDIFEVLKTLLSFGKQFLKFSSPILKNAKSTLHSYFGKEIDKDFLSFIENQLLIVAQTHLENTNFLTLALALSYPFYDNFYIEGGMGKVFDVIEKKAGVVHTNEEVITTEKFENYYKVYTTHNIYETKDIVFNTTYKNNIKEKNHLTQSAFVVYLALKSDKDFLHHYQIIQEKVFPDTISNSIFVSFSDKNDDIMAPSGEYSITISIHTTTLFWDNLSKEEYKEKKKVLQDKIINLFCDTFKVDTQDIIKPFSATPNTFGRYINRRVLGGIPLEFKNYFLKFGSPKVGDFYYCGDNIFPAQGWAGVVAGVVNLRKVIDGFKH